MNLLRIQILLAVAVSGLLQTAAAADELLFEASRPTCGKVCKLVCETKKLTSICYGCESKDICIPDPSRPGCKHCAACFGNCSGGSCADCQSCPPKCQFCWRDWFACGCAEPRSVRVLTKYQAEKKICWYHWEVVDAACCDCVSANGHTGAADKNSTKQAKRTIYKAAPENAHVGDILAVSDAEWVELAAVLSPDPTEVVADTSPKSMDKATGESKGPDGESKPPSLAERLQRMLKK